MRERDGRILEGDERRGILGGEEEYVLCLIYHGCCRGSVECSVRERELYAGVKVGIYLFFWEITKSMTHIARIQSKDTHYKPRLLFRMSISTAHT